MMLWIHELLAPGLGLMMYGSFAGPKLTSNTQSRQQCVGIRACACACAYVLVYRHAHVHVNVHWGLYVPFALSPYLLRQ